MHTLRRNSKNRNHKHIIFPRILYNIKEISKINEIERKREENKNRTTNKIDELYKYINEVEHELYEKCKNGTERSIVRLAFNIIRSYLNRELKNPIKNYNDIYNKFKNSVDNVKQFFYDSFGMKIEPIYSIESLLGNHCIARTVSEDKNNVIYLCHRNGIFNETRKSSEKSENKQEKEKGTPVPLLPPPVLGPINKNKHKRKRIEINENKGYAIINGQTYIIIDKLEGRSYGSNEVVFNDKEILKFKPYEPSFGEELSPCPLRSRIVYVDEKGSRLPILTYRINDKTCSAVFRIKYNEPVKIYLLSPKKPNMVFTI